MREVDASYYGYLDDDDAILIPLEEKASKEAMKKAMEEWKEQLVTKGHTVNEKDEEEDEDMEKTDDLLAPRFVSHVSVPSQKDVEEALLKKKKKELMEKYGIE